MSETPEPTLDPQLRAQVRKDFLLYGLARLGLFLLLTVVIALLALAIGAHVPLVMSALLALLIAFPLSMFVFKNLRARVTREVAEWDAQRKTHKQWVKTQLEGR
ncbi:DUF4229 domain-containing protein [Corynebacterium aquilae]|uniref:Membrane protein n=1 Tax=Corynebacterium aquilae DSM 44791 TaxID=1431546 RepID=A0A1L7CDN3_9CORY|nr:DUF4229 domain-containing protein [Corynebacterium aquilae]APT83961.1 membrane protein [Corynebacterium aquilae DSM 44791]